MDAQLMSQHNYTLNYGHPQNTNSLSRVCRTCLMEREELRSLFTDRLNEMLMSFTTVQVTLNDGLPTNICSQCILNISRAYSFKQQAENSDSTLRQYYLQSSQDSLTENILEASYAAATVSEPDLQNVISGKCQYYSVSQNPEQLNHPVKEQKFKIKSIEILQKKDVEDYSVSDDNGADDDADDDFIVKNESKPGSKRRKNCKICKVNFTNNKLLEQHMKLHSKTKKHKCGECGKSFSFKVGLRTHMRCHGVGEKKHKCKHCGKCFYEINDCVVHERGHTGDRPIVCETCGKTFADPRSLTKHVKIHTGEKNYQCDVCNKKFIHSYTLTAHKRVHTGEKPYVCNVCAHASATSTQLTLHMRTHTQERPYVCPTCPKSFTSKSGLATHQLTHTGERKYICTICGKGSRTSTDLNSHMRTHTGEKPYECKIPLCYKRYKTNSQLSAHMRTHTEDLSVQIETNIDSPELVITSDALNILSDSDFKTHFRLTKASVQMLIKEIGGLVWAKPGRPAVEAPTAILLFLWTLTHNETFVKISNRFHLGQGHSHRIFTTMCASLSNKKNKFIKWPKGKTQEKTIQEFREEDETVFPNVIGSLGYIHIIIPCPVKDGSYFNDIGFCSIILQGICNVNMEFIDISLHKPICASSAWVESPIYQKLTNDKGILPENTFIVADNDYESSDILLALTDKDDSELNIAEKTYYNILINQLNCVKRSFNLLQKNFKRLQAVKVRKVEYAKDIIMAACILHNIVLSQDNCSQENLENAIESIEMCGKNVENVQENLESKFKNVKFNENIDNIRKKIKSADKNVVVVDKNELAVKLNSLMKNNDNDDENQLIYVVNEEDLGYLIDN